MTPAGGAGDTLPALPPPEYLGGGSERLDCFVVGGSEFSEVLLLLLLLTDGRPTTLAALSAIPATPDGSSRNLECLWAGRGLALGEADRKTSRAACLSAATDCNSLPDSGSFSDLISSRLLSMMYVARFMANGVSCSVRCDGRTEIRWMDSTHGWIGGSEFRLADSIASADWIEGFGACDGGSMDGPRPLSRLGLDRWIEVLDGSVYCSTLNPESLEFVRCRPEFLNSGAGLNSAARFE